MAKQKGGVPEGVKVISALYFVSAIFLFLGSGFLFSLYDAGDFAQLASLGISAGEVLVIGLFLLILCIGAYFVGRGLLKAHNWARVAVGVISVLGILSAITNLVGGSVASGAYSLLLHGVIVWYLFIYEESKMFFK